MNHALNAGIQYTAFTDSYVICNQLPMVKITQKATLIYYRYFSHVLVSSLTITLPFLHFFLVISISPLSSSSTGREILHYDVTVFPTEECELNGYSFTSLPEAIAFYTDNRLQGHYLSLPVRCTFTLKYLCTCTT